MITTTEQDRKFDALHNEIGRIYRSPAVDGNFQVDPAAQKQKTKEFLESVAALAKLATEIAANGEKQANSGPNPVTMAMIHRDAEKADKIRMMAENTVEAAKARADAALFKRRD